MKKYIPIIALSLASCLFIYVFYRTENTIINRIVIALFSEQAYHELKIVVTSALPLKDYIVYSLPEGLWVFSITATSSFFYLKVKNRRLKLVIIPMCLALVMELFQLLHFTNGRFDWMDITFAVAFWLLALFLTRNNWGKQPLLRSFDINTICCVASYSIVYLAHVN